MGEYGGKIHQKCDDSVKDQLNDLNGPFSDIEPKRIVVMNLDDRNPWISQRFSLADLLLIGLVVFVTAIRAVGLFAIRPLLTVLTTFEVSWCRCLHASRSQ